jgi:hypothetical protein
MAHQSVKKSRETAAKWSRKDTHAKSFLCNQVFAERTESDKPRECYCESSIGLITNLVWLNNYLRAGNDWHNGYEYSVKYLQHLP